MQSAEPKPSPSAPAGPPGRRYRGGWLIAASLVSIYLGINLIASACTLTAGRNPVDSPCSNDPYHPLCTAVFGSNPPSEAVLRQSLAIKVSVLRYDWQGEKCDRQTLLLDNTSIGGIPLRVRGENIYLGSKRLAYGEENRGTYFDFPINPWLFYVKQFTVKLDRECPCWTFSEWINVPVAGYISGEVRAHLWFNPTWIVLAGLDLWLWYRHRRARRAMRAAVEEQVHKRRLQWRAKKPHS